MNSNDHPPNPTDAWPAARPEHEPEPTWWPAALAFGITLCAWGIITSWLMFCGGLVVTAVAIGGWIRDILYEQETNN